MSDLQSPEPTPVDPDDRDRLLAVTLESAPLGGRVTLRLGPRRTVLVGKNGSGKSLLLEGCADLEKLSHVPFPSPIDVEVEIGREGDGLGYAYRSTNDVNEEGAPRRPVLAERCWQLEGGREIWRVKDGVALLDGVPCEIPGAGEVTLLALRDQRLYPAVPRLRSVLNGFALVRPGIPRTAERFDVVLNTATGALMGAPVSPRLAEMARTVGSWANRRPECLNALRVLGNRTEIFETIEVTRYVHAATPQALARVLVDGIDIGRLADGTLRGLEILIDLIHPRITTLMIEEPETGVHPGLLKRLLAEIDAQALDRQVVISTHSPIVVDWATPAELRLVERRDRKTSVRPLDARETVRLLASLNDDGTLSEFVFGQSE